MFFFNKKENKRAEQVLPGSRGFTGCGGKVVQTMYTHVSKCKNYKKKRGGRPVRRYVL
jgi:hypothetical protein